MEGSPCSGAGDPPPPRQALRRALPLARRALMTARPPRVFMRARKPWVRLRLISLGWKVRFMLAVLSGSEVVEQKGSECTVLTLFLSMKKTLFQTDKGDPLRLDARRQTGGTLVRGRSTARPALWRPAGPGFPLPGKHPRSRCVIVRIFLHGFARCRPDGRRPGASPTSSTLGTPCPTNSHKTASR